MLLLELRSYLLKSSCPWWYRSIINQMNYPLVAKLAASHQLVGVGESTHGTHEFFDFKSQLFKKLTEHGFNVLLLEDSPGVCSQINDYIKSARGNIDSVSIWYK